MLSEELVDIATRHQVYLERLKAGEIKRSDVLFSNLNDDLVKVLNKIEDSDLGVLTKIEAEALIDEVHKNQVERYTEHLKTLILFLTDLAKFEREFELESIDEVTIDAVEPDDDDGEAALWAVVEARPMSATGKLLTAWFAAWMGNETTRAGDLIRRAIAEGWTVSRLKTAFKGTKAQGYRDGLFGSAKRNTATTINTAIQHVASTAREATMERVVLKPKGGKRPKTDQEGRVTSVPTNEGIKVGDKIKLQGYRWISILDKVTSQICRSLDQQVFQFGKGPLPPAHPNCRSSIIAEIFGKYLKRDIFGRFTKKDERTATGAKGTEKVDGTVSYYEWLKTQPEAFQNDALGITRATLFRKGGLSAKTFAALNLGRNFQPLTLDEMRALKPNAFRRAGL